MLTEAAVVTFSFLADEERCCFRRSSTTTVFLRICIRKKFLLFIRRSIQARGNAFIFLRPAAVFWQ